jgi:hypothetical protein
MSSRAERTKRACGNLRTRSKHGDKKLAALDVLELRELIGSFVGDVAVAAHTIAAIERARDQFGGSLWVEAFASRSSTSGPRFAVIEHGGWLDAPSPVVVGPASRFSGNGSSPASDSSGSEVGWDDPRHGGIGQRGGSATVSYATPHDIGDAVPRSVLNDALSDPMPRQDGSIADMQFNAAAASVGASATLVASMTDAPLRPGSDPQIAASTGRPSATTRTPAQPLLPPSPTAPGANGQTVAASDAPAGTRAADTLASAATGATSAADTAAGSGQYAGSGTDAAASAATTDAGTAAGGGAENRPSATTGAAAYGPRGKNCSPGGPPGQTGEFTPPDAGAAYGPQPSTVNSQPSTPPTPPGPPLMPPGQCAAGLADPLFVVDWNDGIVLFPGVTEFEPSIGAQTGPTIDLRAQVYGATVQSYSWDLSQAPSAACVSGQNSYRLQFGWNTMGTPPLELTRNGVSRMVKKARW